ncbi:MAG: hypothetical protein ABIR46_02205 [Candidatus Saccharimonadales bacterium]
MRYNYTGGISVERNTSILASVVAIASAGLIAMATLIQPASAASNNTIDFENPPYDIGTINGQDGWMKTGSFDSEVTTNTYGITSFGGQSLRISNAITSSSFGDQTFSKTLSDAVGEVDSTAGTFSIGTLQNRFETQFDIASANPSAQQVGMVLSVSPDRGDGSRMSYLRIEDGINGLDIFFDDVQGTTNPATFVETQIANGLSRTAQHTVKLIFEAVDGPSNDIVKVWIDGSLVHTGTSWENYYRYDSEAIAEPTPRIVKTVLFRTAVTAVPANNGKGFLFDNLSLSSSNSAPLIAINKDQCKKEGWTTLTDKNGNAFKNQGQCVSSVASNKNN